MICRYQNSCDEIYYTFLFIYFVSLLVIHLLYSKCVNIFSFYLRHSFSYRQVKMLIKKLRIFYSQWGDPHWLIVSTVAYIVITNANLSLKTNPNPK